MLPIMEAYRGNEASGLLFRQSGSAVSPQPSPQCAVETITWLAKTEKGVHSMVWWNVWEKQLTEKVCLFSDTTARYPLPIILYNLGGRPQCPVGNTPTQNPSLQGRVFTSGGFLSEKEKEPPGRRLSFPTKIFPRSLRTPKRMSNLKGRVSFSTT